MKSGKPYALLLPNYVATKSYYSIATAAARGSFFVVPPQARGAAGGVDGRYQFEHPEGTGHASSPFESFWYVHLASYDRGDACSAVATALRLGLKPAAPSPARAVASVDELRAYGLVPTAKRGNPRQRKKKAELK